MDISSEILSDIIVYNKYARFLAKEKRRETWSEIVQRNKDMNIKKYPHLKDEIDEAYEFVFKKEVLPSMRFLQFSNKAIEINHARGYNCAAFAVDHFLAFPEAMFLLLGGCFEEETLVKTKDGNKKIKDITVQDQVLTYDEKEDLYKWVCPTFAGETPTASKQKIELILKNGEVIKCTADHMFFTENKGWVEAQKLSSEDNIKTYGDGKSDTGVEFSKVLIDDARNYYDLSIEGTHNFCLASGEVVHNTGLGFSVQKHHVEKLPVIRKPTKRQRRFVIQDSIIGWADAIKVLMKSYFKGTSHIDFDFSDIRPKGTPLKTAGGLAPGPEGLKNCIRKIKSILNEKEDGSQLTSLEAHDIMCHIADAVLAGGIRRAAMISLFSADDQEMIECKFGHWWEKNPQRGRANNTAILLRHRVTKDFFFDLWKKVELSNAGEPGVYFSNDKEWLINPCQPAAASVITPEGLRTFADIDVGSKIWSESGWTTVVNKWSTGTKPVYRYRTTAGTFVGTDNHRVLSGGDKIQVHDADSIDLLVGPTPLSSFHNPASVIDGLVLGDGSTHKAGGGVFLLVGENDQCYFAPDSEIKDLVIQRGYGGNEQWCRVNTSLSPEEVPLTYQRRVPERYLRGTTDQICSFLRGLYSANGSVVRSRVTLKTASPFVRDDVQLMLNSLGINSYFTTNKAHDVIFNNGTYQCRESYDVNIGSSSVILFQKLIGFIHPDKTARLNDVVLAREFKRSGVAKKTFDIVDVEYLGDETVYDITVDNESHTYWTGGCNVSNCGEVALRCTPSGGGSGGGQFCNLVEINASSIHTQEQLNERSRVGAFIGTLQAGYTDFHYLRPAWQKATEKDALLGVSMTGIATGTVEKLDLREANKIIEEENERVAKLIGINKSARRTVVKPAGTTSLVVGSSSGIHPWHSEYYLRRVRVLKDEPLYKHLSVWHPELLEDDQLLHNTACITIPQKAPDGAITNDSETTFEFLERIKHFAKEWIAPGHTTGANSHNVSATVSVKPDEWQEVGEWMWNNRDSFNGLSVIPFDGGSYIQAPFESCDKETYERMLKSLKSIDLTRIIETQDDTNLVESVACGPQGCDIK